MHVVLFCKVLDATGVGSYRIERGTTTVAI